MKIDKNATHYEYGNGRFDLMTDEEVRTLISDDIMLIYMVLSRSDNTLGSSTGELAHQLYELHLRYPGARFRLEIIPNTEQNEQ